MISKTCFAVIALVTSFAAISGAEARDARVHAFDCKTFGGTPIDLDFSLQNDSPTETMSILCPIPDTSAFPKAAIKTLNIHGFDNYNGPHGATVGVHGRICTSVWYTTSGTCGIFNADFGSVPRDYSLNLLDFGSRWTPDSAADFGYVHIVLPPKNSNGVRASFRGYFLSDK
jgi:hypothetical protein